MKRILYIFAILALTLVTACGDKQMDEMNEFMDKQNVAGIYRASLAEFTYNEDTHQCYINANSKVFAIMNEDGSKYIQFFLSDTPTVGATIDVETKSYGMGLSSSATYKNLTVDKIVDGLCYLRSDADGGYVGIIIGWME
ncbi:MAG: hypothetical protein J6U53_00105 [Tidjanibacter sp.]|nr:hypothetical protein [Tidjanibacter sp.]